jgi:hypothetical protein
MFVTLFAVPWNSTSNITNEEDLKKVLKINNEPTSDIEDDEESNYEPTLNLELQGNDNTNEAETNVTMELETEVQNEKIHPEAFS